MKIEKWIIRNLELFNNCLIPKRLVEMYGIKEVEQKLKQLTKRNVSLNEEESNYMVCEPNALSLKVARKKGKKLYRDTNYIARIKE